MGCRGSTPCRSTSQETSLCHSRLPRPIASHLSPPDELATIRRRGHGVDHRRLRVLDLASTTTTSSTSAAHPPRARHRRYQQSAGLSSPDLRRRTIRRTGLPSGPRRSGQPAGSDGTRASHHETREHQTGGRSARREGEGGGQEGVRDARSAESERKSVGRRFGDGGGASDNALELVRPFCFGLATTGKVFGMPSLCVLFGSYLGCPRCLLFARQCPRNWVAQAADLAVSSPRRHRGCTTTEGSASLASPRSPLSRDPGLGNVSAAVTARSGPREAVLVRRRWRPPLAPL